MTDESTGQIPRFEKKLTIRNKLGLHARPAALFVQTANQFDADIQVTKDGESINGKSIMGIMTLAAGCGTEITVIAQGTDSQDAVLALQRLVLSNFGEDE